MLPQEVQNMLQLQLKTCIVGPSLRSRGHLHHVAQARAAEQQLLWVYFLGSGGRSNMSCMLSTIVNVYGALHAAQITRRNPFLKISWCKGAFILVPNSGTGPVIGSVVVSGQLLQCLAQTAAPLVLQLANTTQAQAYRFPSYI